MKDLNRSERFDRLGVALAIGLMVVSVASPASSIQAGWNEYLDHAYVYSSAESDELRSLLSRTTASVGRSLSEYHAETFTKGSARENPQSEIQIRRKAIAELLLERTGELPGGLTNSAETIEAVAHRLDRPENRYWYHTIHAHKALQEGNAESFVDQILTLWLEVITPLEIPFETYKTLALTQNGNAGFVRTLPHLYESISRLILVHSQSTALDGDIDSLAAIVRVLTDQRVGSDPDAVAVESSSIAFLNHLVERLDGPESDGGSLSYTLALIAAEQAHQRARTELAENGLSDAASHAIRDSVTAYQRAMRNANTLQGQVAIYTRALRQLGEVFATAERVGLPVKIDVPFSIERAYDLYATLHAAKNGGWERHGYVDQGRDAYIAAMQGLWTEIQEASFNAAHYYMAQQPSGGGARNESIVHAINHYSRYLHAFEQYSGDPTGESLPDSAFFGAYVASRGIGDGVLFFAAGDASTEQLNEAVVRYTAALSAFPFDRELWSTLAVALQRSGRESDFLAVAKPVADRVIHSRHVDRWITSGGQRADAFASFRNAFANDRSLVYFGFADANKIDEIEAEFAKLQDRKRAVTEAIAATRAERDDLNARRAEAHRLAALDSGESNAPSPPRVTGAPPLTASLEIARLGVDLEQLSSSDATLENQIDAITESLPTFKATLGHEDLIWELSTQRNHPIHALLRRFAEELNSPTQADDAAMPDAPTPSWSSVGLWLGGNNE